MKISMMTSGPNARPSRLPASIALVLTAMVVTTTASANTVGFESYPLGPSGYYNGSDLAGGFTIGNATFDNNFTDFGGGCCWDGWAVSNLGDNTTPGFGNQYSAYPGGGFGGGGQFGVLYTDTGDITLASPETVTGAFLANTTYAALSMLNGDAFAKQFGGASGTDEDWFSVTIQGWLGGVSTSSVEFFLADYRFVDSADDYIIDEWTWVDLTGLGAVDQLTFSFGSSDVGDFGINTPQYVAMDFMTSVPEPGTGLLCGMGLVLLAGKSRRARLR